MMLSRRDLVQTSSVLGGSTTLARALVPFGFAPSTASLRAEMAQDRGEGRKYIHVVAEGGWDPTRVLADGFDRPIVAMEPGSERACIGDLRFVDHPNRPSVRAFFAQHASKCLIVNGVRVPSIDHQKAKNALSTNMGRTAPPPDSWPHQSATFADHARRAVAALDAGSVQTVHLMAGGGATGWDTHSDNDEGQSPLWEGLFSDLGALVSELHNAPSGTLADRTTIVVCSEMGRSPMLNRAGGKEHWPYTSMLLIRSGHFESGMIGGWDRNWYGIPTGHDSRST